MDGKNQVQKAIRTFGDVFVPVIPALVATGLFLGLKGALLNDNFLALFISPTFSSSARERSATIRRSRVAQWAADLIYIQKNQFLIHDNLLNKNNHLYALSF